MNGKFIISLDFELYWGVRDKKTIHSYRENIKGVHKAIPRMLEIFEQYGIRATFATVGFLFFDKKEELIKCLPLSKPNYQDRNLSPYINHINSIGEESAVDLYHYGLHLIKLIQRYPSQEIGTHTFSHYYCLEAGQTIDNFKDDIRCAVTVAGKYGIKIRSLVFPRNQFNDYYLSVCREQGIIVIRGNEASWLYKARSKKNESKIRRALRLLDAYVNISGHNCYSLKEVKKSIPVNLPASRFLRPYSPKLKILDFLKLKRIKSGMEYAAKNGLVYHLWWHPHNFGIYQDQNFICLEKILKHYQYLNQKYGFKSGTMSELANEILNEE
jgi:peptidoglycan/xylan/chitin deacetylase (PgdA/CDA1 family)